MDFTNQIPDKKLSLDDEKELKDLCDTAVLVLETPGVSLRAQEIANNILEKYLFNMYKRFI